MREDPSTAAELGRLIYVQRLWPLATAGFALGAVAFVAQSFSDDTGGEFNRWFFRVFALVLALETVERLRARHRGARFHERGVYFVGMFRRGWLRYSGFNELTYEARPADAGRTRVRLQIGTPAPKRYFLTVRDVVPRGQEGPLEQVRDAVGPVVAEQLWRRLEQVPWVPWAGSVRLSREGVAFPRVRLSDGRELEFVPFFERPEAAFGPDGFTLREARSGEALVRLTTAEVNFYPGWVLFTWLSAGGGARA